MLFASCSIAKLEVINHSKLGTIVDKEKVYDYSVNDKMRHDMTIGIYLGKKDAMIVHYVNEEAHTNTNVGDVVDVYYRGVYASKYRNDKLIHQKTIGVVVDSIHQKENILRKYLRYNAKGITFYKIYTE